MPKECFLKPKFISIGYLNDSSRPFVIKRNVRRIIPYPEYHDVILLNDIALIELDRPLVCLDLPRPICLPTKNFSKVGNELVIAGWGEEFDGQALDGAVVPTRRRNILIINNIDGGTSCATIDLLKDTLGDRLISRFGPVNWPPRSWDLTPLDYFLWGYVKSLVYADKPQTLDHLEDNIRRVITDIRPQMLEKVIENWTSRLDYIRASRASPMPRNPILNAMPQDYLSNKKKSCQSNNISLFYCNLKFYTSQKNTLY
ncbi:putative LOC100569746 [Trichonephila clavipes]|nr:putative LOC100569746 [Trichonephila clavipes]